MTRLLSVNSYHYERGGSDKVYFAHAALFRDAGWDNAFFSMQHWKNVPSEWSRYFVENIEFGDMKSSAEKLRKSLKVIYSFEAQNKLKLLLDDYRPDVAHVHAAYHHLSPAIMPVLKERGIPSVYTAHDLKLACPAFKMLNSGGICERCRSGNLLNVAIHRCVKDSLSVSAVVAAEAIVHQALRTYRKTLDRVVTPSLFYKAKLEEWGWPAEKLVFIPNFIDVAAAEPSYERGDYLFYLGRLSPEKGLATLVEAVAGSPVPLLIAGTGPEEERLRKLAADLAAPVTFLGHRTGQDLADLVKGALAVVLPSEWYENAPLSVLEAMAAGKVILGADIGGIPELLVRQPPDLLFASGNVAALRGAIDRVTALPASTLSDIGHVNRAFALTFSRTRYRDEMMALYRSLGVAHRD